MSGEEAPVPATPASSLERLRDEAHLLETLNRVGQAVAAELDLERVVQIVTDAGRELTGAAFGSFRPTFGGHAVVRSDDIQKDPRYARNEPQDGVLQGHLPVRSYLAVPVVSRSGEVLGGLFFGHPEPAVFTDRSERLVAGIASQAAIAIDNARLFQAARDADRRKDEFLATLAHELRNPLAPIRNAVEILRLTEADPAAAASARQLLERQLKQLVRLIDDLFDVSRITQGRLELRKEKLDLAVALKMAVETSRPLIETRQHTLHVSAQPDAFFVDADATRIAQVFANLLNNSAKYSPPGSSITARIAREGSDAVVTITDNGVGIPQAALSRVFEMFERVDRESDVTPDGLGIGLTLVRRLVELHGGTVTAQSEGLNCGSTFSVRLPLWLAASLPEEVHATPPETQEGTARRKILVVDDNRDSAMSLSLLLELDGHDVRRAYDGIEALEIADDFRPEVTLLDIGMPRLDGYGAARELRRRDWAKGSLLVALTGWGQQEDKRMAREAGFDHHMVKPVDPDALRRLLIDPRRV
jgi:signal transduction histidine kinase